MKTAVFTQITGSTQEPWTVGGGGVIVSPHKTQVFCHVLKCDFQEVAHFCPLCIVQSQCCLVPFFKPFMSSPWVLHCVKILFGAMKQGRGGGGSFSARCIWIHLEEKKSPIAALLQPESRVAGGAATLHCFCPVFYPSGHPGKRGLAPKRDGRSGGEKKPAQTFVFKRMCLK